MVTERVTAEVPKNISMVTEKRKRDIVWDLVYATGSWLLFKIRVDFLLRAPTPVDLLRDLPQKKTFIIQEQEDDPEVVANLLRSA